jgi:FixJ family two-component response regulator
MRAIGNVGLAVQDAMTVKGHVFLVDDDSEIRSHLGDLLKHLGYGVSDFASGALFLQQARRCSPAVLVLDMRMPQMTGLDLQKSLHERDWRLPIIFMSGESKNQEIIDAMKLGAIDFLWKPFDYTQLVQVIDGALRLDVQRTNDQKRLVRVAALHQSLSPREKDIINLILLGHGNKDIASAKSLMADTVKKHRAQIFEKMHVQSLAALLALCKDFTPTQG